MCQFCGDMSIGSDDTPNLPAIVGQEDDMGDFSNSFAEFMKNIAKQEEYLQEQIDGTNCFGTEDQCTMHNRLSGVWDDYGTWEGDGSPRKHASTYSGNTVIQTSYSDVVNAYVTSLGLLSRDTAVASELLAPDAELNHMKHPDDANWDEVVKRHHLIAADYRMQIDAADALLAKLDSRVYE